MRDPLASVQRLLEAIETQQAVLDAQRAAPTISAWLHSGDEREEAERSLRGLLEALGAAVADGVRARRLEVTRTAPAANEGAAIEAHAATESAAETEAHAAALERQTSPAVDVSPATGSAPRTEATRVPPSDSAPAPRVPSVEITPATLAKLQESLRGGGMGAEQACSQRRISRTTRSIVRKAMDALGPTPDGIASRKRQRHELKRILRVIAQQLETWGAAGTDANHALTGWVAARLRGLQDDFGVGSARAGPTPDLTRAIRELAHHTKVTRPGVVHGLARGHRSRGATWWVDAKEYERTLRELCGLDAHVPPAPAFNEDDALRRLIADVRIGLEGPALIRRVRDLLDAGVSPQEKRLVRVCIPIAADLREDGPTELAKAIEAELAVDEQEEEATPPPVPSDWPHFGATAGKTAVIVGGDPRPERVARLKEAFRFASLDWIDNPTGAGRGVDSLVKKMHNGTVDVVIVLRAFSSHKVSDKVFANRCDGCLVVLADTYGVNQVRLGIERFV